jgi:hypothetical protein
MPVFRDFLFYKIDVLNNQIQILKTTKHAFDQIHILYPILYHPANNTINVLNITTSSLLSIVPLHT